MTDYSADGYHYLSTSKTPSKMNEKERVIDNSQVRVQLNSIRVEFLGLICAVGWGCTHSKIFEVCLAVLQHYA